jgi:dUTP pyrophosphatase
MNDELLMDPGIKSFVDSIHSLTEMDDAIFTDEAVGPLLEGIEDSFSQEKVNQAVNQIIQNLESQGTTKVEAKNSAGALKEFVNTIVYGDKIITGNKRKVVDVIVEKIFNIFDTAFDKYHSYAIELPIQLEDGAQVPTYAHDSDAAADMYAMEDVEVPAHSKGVPVKTGVHIQLPEGWVAFVLPRSSIGAKTPLRLSNSVGLIDSGYRGELGVLYDNTSDEPYTINAGDRIAQLLVMPNYRFQAKVVDILADSDRGEGGFGSSGT